MRVHCKSKYHSKIPSIKTDNNIIPLFCINITLNLRAIEKYWRKATWYDLKLAQKNIYKQHKVMKISCDVCQVMHEKSNVLVSSISFLDYRMCNVVIPPVSYHISSFRFCAGCFLFLCMLDAAFFSCFSSFRIKKCIYFDLHGFFVSWIAYENVCWELELRWVVRGWKAQFSGSIFWNF